MLHNNIICCFSAPTARLEFTAGLLMSGAEDIHSNNPFHLPLPIPVQQPRLHLRTFRSVSLSVSFLAKLSASLHTKHRRCLPLDLALEIISQACKVNLDQALNSGKCKVLLQIFRDLENYLTPLTFVLDTHTSPDPTNNKLTRLEGLSGCYYALKNLCRLLLQCKQYLMDCTGYLPSRQVFAKLESSNTMKSLIIALSKCFRLLQLRVEGVLAGQILDPVAQVEFRWECTPPCLPGLYLAYYLQLQSQTDRLHVLAQLTKTPASFWPIFINWKNKLTAAEESALRQQLIVRLSYENNEGEDVKFLKEGLFVNKTHVKVKRYLGSGSYGQVEEVVCFGEKYAMKTIKGINNIQNAGEAVIQARLHHPNIVKLIWYTVDFETPNTLSLLFELLDTDLETFIQQRTNGKLLNYPLVSLHVMQQIARAMEYLHSQGIMHRDLKAANVLVDLSWSPDAFAEGYIHVKVADFGLAKAKTVGGKTIAVHTAYVGTKYWRAPEVLKPDPTLREGEAAYSFSADVYSFAMTCYEILTGKTPFGEFVKMPGLKDRIVNMNERPALPEELHVGLKDLINRCWDGRPQARPSFTQICHELEQVEQALIFG